MVLTDRDFEILKLISRWRFVLGRHVKELIGFTGARSCDRRLKTLLDTGYIKREKILYGVPSIYTLTHKGKVLLCQNPRQDKIKIDKIPHDILVLDSAIYIINTFKISLFEIITEKEQHSKDGFSNRKHCPDFIFNYKNNEICVEVELTAKSKSRFLDNLKSNYTKFDKQIWIIPKNETRNKEMIKKSGFPDISILDCEVITNYIRKRK